LPPQKQTNHKINLFLPNKINTFKMSSNNNSISVASEARRSSSVSSRVSSAWTDLKEAAREHNRSVNASYQALYGIGAATDASRSGSTSSTSSTSSWTEAKSAARKHNESVNNAFGALYGANGKVSQPTAAEIKAYGGYVKA
jgi:hypothetical protein